MVLVGDPASTSAQADELARVIAPYYLFRDWGADVVVAAVSEDAWRLPRGFIGTGAEESLATRFRQDREARDLFADSLRFDEVYPEDFAAAFCVGLPHLAGASSLAAIYPLLRALLSADRPVALLHAPELGQLMAGSAGPLLMGAAAEPLGLARALLAHLPEGS